MEIRARNVNDALNSALWKVKLMGEKEETRNGVCLVFPEPVMTIYARPWERVLFWDVRDQNPFFTLMESLWMLAGRNDLAFVEQFNSRMKNFSDDGRVLNGAYGYRWRPDLYSDQLIKIIDHLKKTPNSRRAVLQMWNMWDDLEKVDESKDVCCNTNVYFDLRGGSLNMTVCCRSNDMIWGAYGANAVHFSMLQEYMAISLDAPIGEYRQFSNNLHAYMDLYDLEKYIANPPTEAPQNYYAEGNYYNHHFPIMSIPREKWDSEVREFCSNPTQARLTDPFLVHVARPMYMTYLTRKQKLGDGLSFIPAIQAWDWQIACKQWIERRENAKAAD